MLLYQLAFVALLAFLLMMFGFPQQDAIFYGVLLYFVLFYLMRTMLTYSHRMGIRSYRKKQYAEAIQHFRTSGEFFAAHPTLDQLRFAVLFSVSRLSYRELAESNSGFCYIQLGSYDEAEQAFHRALELNPSNQLARTALDALQKARPNSKKGKKSKAAQNKTNKKGDS
jgi:tetratricopeptide (TPR) repeat protein